MGFASFARLCKESGLIDKNFSIVEADIIFANAANKCNRYQHGYIDFTGFKFALSLIAEKKGAPQETVTNVVMREDPNTATRNTSPSPLSDLGIEKRTRPSTG